MSRQINLKEAERSVFRLAAFHDGWWDILLGGELILLSAYPVFRAMLGPTWNLVLFFGGLALLLIVIYAVKKFVITPRLGTVKFGPAQNALLRKVMAATSLLVLATFAFLLIVSRRGSAEPSWAGAPQWVRDFGFDIFFALLIVGFFSLLAYALGVARLHLYGWLMGLGNLFSNILDAYAGMTFHWPMFVAGSVIVLIGATLFARFLRHYPVAIAEM